MGLGEQSTLLVQKTIRPPGPLQIKILGAFVLDAANPKVKFWGQDNPIVKNFQVKKFLTRSICRTSGENLRAKSFIFS